MDRTTELMRTLDQSVSRINFIKMPLFTTNTKCCAKPNDTVDAVRCIGLARFFGALRVTKAWENRWWHRMPVSSIIGEALLQLEHTTYHNSHNIRMYIKDSGCARIEWQYKIHWSQNHHKDLVNDSKKSPIRATEKCE